GTQSTRSIGKSACAPGVPKATISSSGRAARTAISVSRMYSPMPPSPSLRTSTPTRIRATGPTRPRKTQVIAHLPDFVRLYWRLFRDARVSIVAKAALVLTLAYVIGPADIIPDFIPVLGEMDDIGIALGGLWLFIRLCPPEVVRERVREISARKMG